MTEKIIKDLIDSNEENKEICDGDSYSNGYYEGYHDALVDLMNKLEIQHNEEFYNE